MSIQLADYGDAQLERGIPGLEADNGPNSIVNRRNASTAEIDFGVAIAAGADADTAVLPSTGCRIIGLSVRHATMQADKSGNVSYAPKATIPVMEIGRLWAIPKDPVSPGDAVTTDATGALSTGGTIPVPGALWETPAAAGSIARVRINLLPSMPAASSTSKKTTSTQVE
ncbi:MAG: hypothetical protein ON057_001510 [Glomeribacter sp. 1016415]|uniref:Uncharacterized protein n=1 Tax=Linnemannia elongata AG-77 TaxID=1314771 RepID=A0A197JB02_9FUNG|nr:hypothetical protein [Glomeribacter sp. 1016415]OAQ22228.1 hypothetical protein K457DRAFT_26255 [Linnemannia elongata AG-77]